MLAGLTVLLLLLIYISGVPVILIMWLLAETGFARVLRRTLKSAAR